MEGERKSCPKNKGQRRNKPYEFKSLTFKKCIFLTDDQFNKNQILEPKYTLFIKKIISANSVNDIDNAIINELNIIYEKLVNIYNPSVKIPYPIFIMIGRELEKSSSLFDNNDMFPIINFKPYSPTAIKYGNAIINKTGGQMVILDYIKGFFNSGSSTDTDIEKYNKSMINSYEFIGNVRIYIHIPFLTNECKFISNLSDLTDKFIFFDTIINSDFYLNITRTSTFNDDKFRKAMEKAKMNKKMIDLIIKIIKTNDQRKFSLYDDLNNLCFDGGCVSDVGDDFNSLLPSFTDDEDTNTKNARDKSPFMPNKCISKTNGYLCNVRFVEGNKDINEYVKENIMSEITENLINHQFISNLLDNNIDLDEETSKKINDLSPVNLVVSVINNFLKNFYSNDLNEDEKEKQMTEKEKKKIKLNHYSRDYSENIIKELAYLKKMNGIPEYVMSLYFFNITALVDKIAYMPFKTNFPTNENVLNFDDERQVNDVIYSLNRKYAMILFGNGLIPIYNLETKQIIYFFNRNLVVNPLGMYVKEDGLYISYENSQGNTQKENKLFIKLVEKCEYCNPPYSLILNDEGFIRIYGNGYYDATSLAFKNYIDDEIIYTKNFNLNSITGRRLGSSGLTMDNIDLFEKSLKDRQTNVNENYTFCQNTNSSCVR